MIVLYYTSIFWLNGNTIVQYHFSLLFPIEIMRNYS